MPTDEELIAWIKSWTPGQWELFHAAAELDDVSLEAMVILVEGLAAGIPEKEAAQKAASFLRDHGRPEAAQMIIDKFPEA